MPPRRRGPTSPPEPRVTPPRDADVETRSREARTRRWQARLARARAIRAQWEQDYAVEKAESYFLGQFGAGREAAVNHFAATLRTKRPNLYYAAPKFYVRPKAGRASPPLERVAATGEGVLEAIATREQNLKRAGRLAVHQAFFRIGVLKIVYDPRLIPNPRAGQPVLQTDDAGQPIVLTDDAEQPILDADGAPQPIPVLNPATGRPVVEPDSILTDEVYRWAWVDAATVLLPDEGCDPACWTWIGEEVTVSLAEAKADPRLPAEVRAGLRSNASHRRRSPGTTPIPSEAATDPDPLFIYTEVYDHIDQRLLFFADGQGGGAREPHLLADRPLPDWIEDDPYALLILGDPIMGPTPSPWPVPIVKDWLPVQDDSETLGLMITEGAKRSARKVGYDEATFPDEESARAALQSPHDMEAFKLTDVTRPPAVIDAADVNPAVYKAYAISQQNWRTITGETGARLAAPEADTATEATFVERAAGVRDAEEQDRVNDWAAVAGAKMLQCVQATLTLPLWIALRGASDAEVTEYAVRVLKLDPALLAAAPALKDVLRTRAAGARRWLPITRETLQFEAEVTVAPGSARPRNLAEERTAFFNALTVIAQQPMLLLSRELTSRIFRFFELDDPRLVDELVAMGQMMVQVQARQAGREQGGADQGAPAGANGALGGGLSAMLGMAGSRPV